MNNIDLLLNDIDLSLYDENISYNNIILNNIEINDNSNKYKKQFNVSMLNDINYSFLYFYEIDILKNIIEDSYYISTNLNNDKELIGFILLDNYFQTLNIIQNNNIDILIQENENENKSKNKKLKNIYNNLTQVQRNKYLFYELINDFTILLKSGYDINKKNKNGLTIIYYFFFKIFKNFKFIHLINQLNDFMNNNINIIKFFIKNNSDIFIYIYDIGIKGKNIICILLLKLLISYKIKKNIENTMNKNCDSDINKLKCINVLYNSLIYILDIFMNIDNVLSIPLINLNINENNNNIILEKLNEYKFIDFLFNSNIYSLYDFIVKIFPDSISKILLHRYYTKINIYNTINKDSIINV
jgi:hypothetical protein